jgi:glycerophosphoryl diester phosphodiesterase
MPRRFGHRGAMGYAPENTIASFERAIALGCDGVETDVWVTPRGLLITHEPPGEGGRYPALDEVLDLCRGRCEVNVELKSPPDARAAREAGARLATSLAARGHDGVFLSCFRADALVAARANAPGLRLALLFVGQPLPGALVAQARELGLWALHPQKDYVDAELVRAAHLAGLQVNTWTVNEPADIARLVALEVDAIMSDYPDRVPKG